ncbi:sulfotransferase family protein [Marinimicrobium locisalis]|uniref:sulfotransferase family protein n=1 Tax=Marinimicrobium locisalis TaxID=546022 RepID=UPI0032219AE0
MKGTRFRSVLRESLGNIWRECRIAVTPVPKPDKWVFIVGCYNSGTTLLSELMSRHPDISGIPTEGHFITDQFVKDFDIGLPRMWVDREDMFRLTEDDEGPEVLRLKKEWGMRLDLSKKILLEKSPPNAARTRWFQKHFENAHFIGLVRNGYAVAEGISRKGDPKHIREGWPIERSARQWARSNEVLQEDAKHLEHFTWVKYEELAADPKTTLNRLAEFLGLPPFPESAYSDSFKIHERNDSVKDLNQVSIDRLSAEQIRTVTEVAGDGLRHHGYDVL